MPTPAGAPQVGEEAARKLLGGASPASLSPEELLPAIDALAAAKTTAAADVLSTLSKPKAVAKAARRALFRLQTQGIHPSAKPQESQTVAESDRPAAPRITLQEARVSSYDPRGTRAISILAEKPFTGLINLFAIASDTEGLLDVELSTTTKKAYFARLENFSRQYPYIDFVPLPADYANQVLYQCAELNEKAGHPLPQDFSMWRSFGAERPDPAIEPPILSELSADEVLKNVQLEQTAELAGTEFEGWVYDEEQLKEPLARLDTARGGPLVISSDAQKGREKTIMDEACDAIFNEDELARAKQRLQETAHLLFQHGQRAAAERCLRGALSVTDPPPHSQPFLRELIVKSIEFITHPEHEHEHQHQHEHEPTARTESGLVLPA